jgi:hypothetical protein
MRIATSALIFLCLAGPACAANEPAMPLPPIHNAFETPHAVGQECLGGSQLLAHAAYTPASMMSARCGQPLSTDTLMTAHRWNRT